MEKNIIITALPLVYRRGNVLTVENGLNLDRKSELWGILLLSGTMVALQCGPGNNVSTTSWNQVKKFAQTIRYNGKPGFLPSKDVLKKHWGETEKQKFEATVKVLKKNDIAVDGYWGCLWCSEKYNSNYVYYFGLQAGLNAWSNKALASYSDRIVVAFY